MTHNHYTVRISPRTIATIVMVFFACLALVALHDLVLVFLTSIVLSSFVEFGVQALHKWKIRRTLAVVLIYVVTLSLVALLFYFFIPIFIDEISGFATLIAKYAPNSKIIQSLESGQAVNGAQTVVSNIVHSASPESIIKSIQSLSASLSGGVFQTVNLIFGGIFNFVVVIVLSFYLSMQERGIENFLRIVLPKPTEDYAIDLWRRTERKIGLWFQGQLILGVIVGVLIYLGLMLLGVPYALLLAISAGVFELIPFGIILAAVPAISSAFSASGITLALLVTGLYAIVQQFENNLIAPLIVNKVVGISPLVVILALLIGTELAGFFGLIISIPVAVLCMEYFRDVEKEKATTHES